MLDKIGEEVVKYKVYYMICDLCGTSFHNRGAEPYHHLCPVCDENFYPRSLHWTDEMMRVRKITKSAYIKVLRELHKIKDEKSSKAVKNFKEGVLIV